MLQAPSPWLPFLPLPGAGPAFQSLLCLSLAWRVEGPVPALPLQEPLFGEGLSLHI